MLFTTEQNFVLASSFSTGAQILISTPYVFRERKNEKNVLIEFPGKKLCVFSVKLLKRPDVVVESTWGR